MDTELKAQLEGRLYERMSHENEAYLADLKTKPVEEIINSAYQIACRENILYLFEEETTLSVRQLQVLTEMSAPLRELYEDWCARDSNEMELLWDSVEDRISNTLERRAELCYRNPRTPIYDKTYSEARARDELYEWRANHQRNLACNRMFSEKAESAHHSQTLQPFLRDWTAEYGLKRCMFVLSCTMAERDGDGRFYPPARQAAARFSSLRETHGERTGCYANNVHSGIINLAMEKLLKMERPQNRENRVYRKQQEKSL